MNIYSLLLALVNCTAEKRPFDNDDNQSKRLRRNEGSSSDSIIDVETVENYNRYHYIIFQRFVQWYNYYFQSFMAMQNKLHDRNLDQQQSYGTFPNSEHLSSTISEQSTQLCESDCLPSSSSAPNPSMINTQEQENTSEIEKVKCSPRLRFKDMQDLSNYFDYFKNLVKNIESKDEFLKFVNDCVLNEKALKTSINPNLNYLDAVDFSPALKEFFYEKLVLPENQSNQNRVDGSNESDQFYNSILQALGADENTKKTFDSLISYLSSQKNCDKNMIKKL